MSTNQPQRRSSARYRVKDDSGLTVTIQRADETSASLEVRLLDLSHGGAKMRLSQKISAREVLAVRIESDASQSVIAVAGEVCWVAPATGDYWTLGCSFKPTIPSGVLRDFAAAGVIERREHRRERVSLTATAMWESSAGTCQTRVIDFSQGGFCLWSPKEATLSERTLLDLETPDADVGLKITGRAKWQVASQDGYCIGYEFLEPRDFILLHELVSGPTKSHATATPQVRSARLVTSLGGLIAVAIIASLPLWDRAVQVSGRGPLGSAAKFDESGPSFVVLPEDAGSGGFTHPLELQATAIGPSKAVPRKRSPAIDHMRDLEMIDSSARLGEGEKSIDVGQTEVATSADAVSASPEFRLWTDRTGQYRVVAKLLKVVDGVATFRKENGRLASVALDRLCEDDARLVDRWLADQRQPDEAGN